MFPAPAYAAVLVGEGNAADGDVEAAKTDLSWGEVHKTGEETAERTGRMADEDGPRGPFLAGTDGPIAAGGRELGAPVVSVDEDLTHEGTKKVVDGKEYC